jgi:ribosome-binding factor A
MNHLKWSRVPWLIFKYDDSFEKMQQLFNK